MILRLVAFVDIALRCDRALLYLHPEEDDCEAPVGGCRNRGSKPNACSRICARSTTGKGRLRTEKFSNTID